MVCTSSATIANYFWDITLVQTLQRLRLTCLIVFAFGASIGSAFAAEPGILRVGVAKVDMTPTDPTGLTNLFEVQYTGVHDKIYARAIVLGNDVTTAALIAMDSVEITDGTQLTARIARETGIPTSNIIMAATHNHSAPLFSLQNAGGTRKAGPAAAAWIARVEDDLVAALKQAKANMQPARVAVGSGYADININRDQLTPNGSYTLGRNQDGPSDKAVWVVKFESTAGKPLALLINYAVHGVVVNLRGSLLTGELAGATSRFVEQHYDDKIVAVWTMGAAGDQAPILMPQMSEKPDVENDFKAVDVLGRILGEEVVRVADSSKNPVSEPRIWGMEKTVTCPGQKLIENGQDRKIVDADPVNFRLSVLMIDRIAITSVSAEVVTNIYQHLHKESPFTNTMMITIANGRIGYIPQDASYANPTFEVFGSPLKKGCGESTIVNGLLGMMRQY